MLFLRDYSAFSRTCSVNNGISVIRSLAAPYGISSFSQREPVFELSGRRAQDVPLDELNTAFTEAFPPEGMEKAGDMRLKRAFGLNAADYEEYLYYTPDNTMSVSEFLVVKCRDASAVESVEAGIASRLAVQKKNFDGYGTDQTDLLNHAKVKSLGNYVIFIVSREADAEYAFVQDYLSGRNKETGGKS